MLQFDSKELVMGSSTPRTARTARAPRANFALVCWVMLVGSAGCSCGDGNAPLPGPTRPLPGPTNTGFTEVTASTVAAIGLIPFDVDQQDLAGPNSHDAQYGKLPEIVAVPGVGFVDVVIRSNDPDEMVPRAFYLRVADTAGTLALDEAMEIPSLGRLLGFARGADGTFYYATGTTEPDLSATNPGENEYRTNVVRVYHFDASGDVLFDVDLDLARHAANEDAEKVINPGVASSARLTVAGNVLALVHGINTDPDSSINNVRHQKALSTFLDASTGAIRDTSGIWMSHSFDQRYLVDGTDIVEVHLGDAYDRAIVFSRIVDANAGNGVAIYRPKGATGANNTRTRLGDIVRVGGAGTNPMLALFSTERTSEDGERISGSRDLGLVRISGDAVDASFGNEWVVNSSGDSVTNRALFLTSYHTDAPGTEHAERPKLVPIGGDQFVVLFEHWTYDGANTQEFEGTWAIRVDGSGAVLTEATRVSDHHLPRGDDAFPYGAGAAWLTGDRTTHELMLHVVASDLSIQERIVP